MARGEVTRLRLTARPQDRTTFRKRANMLWTICVILFVLWALGMVTSYTMGGLLHILLVLAVIMIVINLIQGRRTIV